MGEPYEYMHAHPHIHTPGDIHDLGTLVGHETELGGVACGVGVCPTTPLFHYASSVDVCYGRTCLHSKDLTNRSRLEHPVPMVLLDILSNIHEFD